MPGRRRARRQITRTSIVAAAACALIAIAPGGSANAGREEKGETAMRKYGAVVVLFAVLGTAATATSAIPAGESGEIAFRRYLDPGRTTGAIFVVRADGSGLRQVTRPSRRVVDEYPDWSPDGRKLVFHRKVPCPPGGGRDGMDRTCDLVYTIGRDGTGLKPLVPCAFKAADASGQIIRRACVGVHTPAWSRDGTKVAFSYSLVDDRWEGSLKLNRAIWIVNADGTDPRQVTELTPGVSWDNEPHWSPDGTRLVFTRVDLERRADAVFVVNSDGTDARQLTPWQLSAGGDPEWSPDGRWIVFIGHPRDGSENVYKVRPDGSALTNLTKQRAGGFHYLSASFSPDGSRIVSARTPGAGKNAHADLVIMSAGGRRIRALTRTPLWESSVDWGSRG
jgi:TolB protein